MMLKLQSLLVVLLAATAASAAAVPATPTKSVKREIDDARVSGPYSSFPLGATETLGTGAFSNLAYPGSLGNVYAHDDEFYGSPDYYEYPQYAAGYGNYRSYGGFYNDFDGSALGLPTYPYGLRGGLGVDPLTAGYPYYYPRSGSFVRPASFYGRLAGYYD